MPELPEVETIVGILNRLVDGKTIDHVQIKRKQTIDCDTDFFVDSLKNQTIKNITRIGKFIIFHLTNDVVMISHLRMEGKFFLKEKNTPLNKHDLVIFYFKDGTFLTYNDTRRFGRMVVDKESTYMSNKPICNVGPDPFMLNDEKLLAKAFQNKKIPIKQALLDQSIMSGLGNIYVDEVLFQVKLHPLTPANAFSLNELKAILNASRDVLTKAIKSGGSTIKSYHPQEGVSGNFQVQLQVYGKKDKPCPTCGRNLSKILVNSRGTTFCPHCQANKCLPYVVGISGAISSGKSLVGEYLAKKGFILLDSDKIIHEFYKNNLFQEKIKKIIPSLVIKNNDIDRKYLKDFLVKNPKQKKELESYLYDELYKYIKSFIYSLNKTKKVALEVPMIFQSHIEELCNDIFIIEVSPLIQKERLIKRNGDYDSYIKLNESYYLQEDKKKATAIINNNKDVASLYKKLETIFGK